MPIVPAICPNCGGTLEIDNSKEAAVCKYCSTPFIVEKAINNYITQNNNYIEKAIFDSSDSERNIIRRGISQIELGKLEDARRTFLSMVKLYPDNYLGWLGLYLLNSIEPQSPYKYKTEEFKRNTLFYCPSSVKTKLGDMNVFSGELNQRTLFEIKEQEKIIESLKRAGKTEKPDDLLYRPSMCVTAIIVLIITIPILIGIKKIEHPLLHPFLLYTVSSFVLYIVAYPFLYISNKKRKANAQPPDTSFAENKIKDLKRILDKNKNYRTLSYYLGIMKEENK